MTYGNKWKLDKSHKSPSVLSKENLRDLLGGDN